MSVRRISVEQRRARLAVRHRLATKASSVVDVARAVVALHGTDPASVYLASLARMENPSIDDVAAALYDDRSVVRMLGMRRTVFCVPSDFAPVVQSSCTQAVAVRERKKLVRHLEDSGIAKAERWLADIEKSTVDALVHRGEAFASELSEDVPLLDTRLNMSPGKPYAATPRVTNRVLSLLAAEGRIVRGRPRGSWLSSQYQWVPIQKWLAGGMPELAVADAQAELVRNWLAAYGPGTVADLRWWTGLPAGRIKKALAQVNTVEVDLGGEVGVMGSEDEDPEKPQPWAALLPALDPTAMGWAERGWFLGDHAPALFDGSGNIGPTVWWDGRVVGGWAQQPTGEVVFSLLEDVGADATAAITAVAQQLQSALDGTRVTPRFRTPLEKSLSSGGETAEAYPA